MARLKVSRNSEHYAELTLSGDKVYTIGRKEDCDLVLQADPGVSRRHLTIECNESGQWIIKVLSDHIPVQHKGDDLKELICEESPVQIEMFPYTFELEFDAANAPAPEPESMDEQAPPIDESLSFAHESPESAPQEPSEDIPMVVAESVDEEDYSNGPFMDDSDDELSFAGSEEKTSELRLKGEPYLKFMYSTHSESIRLKGNKWTAGRDTIAQIHLDDKKASRQHFSIEKVGDDFFIKDLKSANGTLINGQDLTPLKAVQIKSGDIITVNQLTIIFELRDLSFSNKLDDLPLQAYSGPMILTSQDWEDSAPPPPQEGGQLAQPQSPAQLSADELAQLPGTVEKLPPQNNIRKPILVVAAVLALVIGYVFSGGEKPKPTQTVGEKVKTFESLSPEDKNLVVETYTFINNLYKDDKFQLALNELEKLHRILPYYKDSKEIQAKCEQAQETLRQMEFIREQQRAQEETKRRVESIIAECKMRYSNSQDLPATKACVSEAQQLDPDNSEIQNLIAGVELRIQKALEDEEKRKKYNDNVEKGVQLYLSAENLFKNKKYHDAISAYSAHVNSNLPDPDKLKKKSERKIASIEKKIQSQKNSYMGKARYYSNQDNLKNAILYAEKARKIDPFDYSVANFIHASKHTLTQKMRKLYTDSVIEEKFGNLELSKSRWKQIIKEDIPTGEYYLKAKRKLQQYGL